LWRGNSATTPLKSGARHTSTITHNTTSNLNKADMTRDSSGAATLAISVGLQQ